jgi:1-pyrroline-5-carboxylate dehydrogenase
MGNASGPFRITYSVLDADMSALHRELDQAVEKFRKDTRASTPTFPSYLAGKPFISQQFLEKRSPIDGALLARFHKVPVSQLDAVIKTAKCAQWAWGRLPWQERVKTMRKAAEYISAHRIRMATVMMFEVGKNRLEALGDVEESADLIRYYAAQLEDAQGFVKPLGKLSPNEDTRSVLKPYGVFAVVSPFNFPLALSTGMASAALLAGNAVVLKPSQEAPWCGELLNEALTHAGLPDGVFQLLHGTGSELGSALAQHPQIDGVAFTGSKQVGMQILHAINRDHPKPCLMEMGGKNPTIITRSADLDAAVEGCVRSAYGLSGQKCSALSRVFVDESVFNAFIEKFKARASQIVVGDPTAERTYLGPVINAAAVKRHRQALEEVRRDGKVLWQSDENVGVKGGSFVPAVLATVPPSHRLWRDELFAPFLLVEPFTTFDAALARANDAEYGLTAGIFSTNNEEINQFMDQIEAGVVYANRKTGATTGAWPGVQAFCGWKGSGSTGKGGCGPYYVSQFMKEQSQTRML